MGCFFFVFFSAFLVPQKMRKDIEGNVGEQEINNRLDDEVLGVCSTGTQVATS